MLTTNGRTMNKYMSINNVDTYSEQHRNSCEARHMLTLPLSIRRKELEILEKIRGKHAVEYLKNEMILQHKLKKTND
jgi:hypothetical protein